MSNHLTGRQRDEMRETLKRTIDWVMFADTKAAAIGAILGIYIGVSKDIVVPAFLNVVNGFYGRPMPVHRAVWSAAVVYALVYAFGRTLWFVAKTIRARTTNNSASLIYFGHISSMTLQDFQHQFKAASENDLDKTLVDQVYANSEIASKKFKYINESVTSILTSTVALVIGGFIMSIR
jgi:hypothetical protein